MNRHVDKQLYTYVGEKDSLILSTILMLVVLFGFMAFSLGVAIIVLGLALAFIRIRQGQLLGNSALVTSKNFTKIDQLVDIACERLGEAKPKVHVVQEPYLNAFAIGFTQPFSIVVHSATVKAMDDDELSFILGHELGHIKSRHTLWLSLIAPLGKNIPGFDLIFGIWQRKAEYTCDRAGLIVSRDLNAAIRAMIKISSGPDALEHTNVTEFLKQATQIDASQLDRAGEFLGTHPYVTNRIKELIAFSQSPVYHHLTGGAAQQDFHFSGRVCPNCKHVSLREGDAFCMKCGSALIYQRKNQPEPLVVESLSCTNCHGPIDADMKFCTNCGQQVAVTT